MAKSKTFFGLPQCYDKSYCTLVESPLDAVRLAGLGIPALSSLGAWVSKEQVTLLARNFNRVYLALDNDKTGRESAAVIAPLLRRAGTVSFPWDYSGMLDEEGSPAKDPGDVVDDEMLLHSWTKTQRMGF
jgi:DNA primase